jgi:hypothetical protein
MGCAACHLGGSGALLRPAGLAQAASCRGRNGTAAPATSADGEGGGAMARPASREGGGSCRGRSGGVRRGGGSGGEETRGNFRAEAAQTGGRRSTALAAPADRATAQ